jgi:ElaB/YqjD/DUF883 family membrane-anchored ribosome-binding protein
MGDTIRTLEKELHKMRDHAEDIGGAVKDRLRPVDSWVRTLVEDRPLVALGGAMAIGYLAARLLRRR